MINSKELKVPNVKYKPIDVNKFRMDFSELLENLEELIDDIDSALEGEEEE